MTNDMTERHLMRILITPELWGQIMTTGWDSGGIDEYGCFRRMRCEQGLPEGAKYFSSHYDPQYRCLVLVFEHPEFPLVELDGEIPMLYPVFVTENVKLTETLGDNHGR